MAKQSHDREDLFRDGTQMPIRGRTQIKEIEVVVGFRNGGSASLYWDQDPVYQFNADGELRRVFFTGLRYSAQHGSLVRLGRSRVHSTPTSSQTGVDRLVLNCEPLAKDESSDILDNLHFCLSQLSAKLLQSDPSSWESKGESVEAFRKRLACWISSIDVPCEIAHSPAVT